MRGRATLEERFWSKVDTSGSCWLWQGAKQRDGYGSFGAPATRRAHRIAYELAHGPIPVGLFVCHTCDNPGCVNPAHLFLGTHQDNMADQRAKGRGRLGLRNGRGKLSDAQIADIRARFTMGERASDLAEVFGVTTRHIQKVVTGKRRA